MHPYSTLTPDRVIEAVEAVGYAPDGRVLALNSYENRVFQVGIDQGTPVVAKFYRPGRWKTPAILEEHEFALELARAEVPVVAPVVRDGRSLFELAGFRYAVYPREGGRWPELATREERARMGRFLARIHAIGRTRAFRHRPHLDWRAMGRDTARYLLEAGWIPPHLEPAYASLKDDVLALVELRFAEAAPYRTQRLHGDCHPGNVLWTDAGPHFVDLDDCVMGPPVQDLWMLLAGPREDRSEQLAHLLAGYEEIATSLRSSNRSGRCGSCTTPAGSRAAGTTPRSRGRSRGSRSRSSGSSTCSTCASNWRRWKSRRSRREWPDCDGPLSLPLPAAARGTVAWAPCPAFL
jgi:Ser/Thr protein kinase RdoA (MazF antagonist)